MNSANPATTSSTAAVIQNDQGPSRWRQSGEPKARQSKPSLEPEVRTAKAMGNDERPAIRAKTEWLRVFFSSNNATTSTTGMTAVYQPAIVRPQPENSKTAQPATIPVNSHSKYDHQGICLFTIRLLSTCPS
jgi:hypothetical protein